MKTGNALLGLIIIAAGLVAIHFIGPGPGAELCEMYQGRCFAYAVESGTASMVCLFGGIIALVE